MKHVQRRAMTMLLLISLMCGISVKAKSAATTDTTRYQLREVSVQAERVRTSASDEHMSQRELQLMPISSSQDVLRLVPGLMLAQHAGGGKAEQIFLRGFDCDHGTDISISVDESPVNMVSHGHGQGYADIHYVIPEMIEDISVLKGPYFARYGDQATAGIVRIQTMDSLRDNIVKSEVGMFNTYRAMAAVGTRLASSTAYAAAELLSSQGYFDASQDFLRRNVMLKVNSQLSSDWSLRSSAFLFDSKWNASGQIPERAVAQSVISPYGSIDSLEGGNTARGTLQFNLRSQGATPWTISAGYSRYAFQLFSNFTFFAVDPLRGDMIEQTDRRSIFHFSVANERPLNLCVLTTRINIGASLRSDNILTALYHNQERVRLDTKVDAEIRQLNAAVYAEDHIYIGECSLSLGLRADYFRFAVHDDVSQQDNQRQTLFLSPKLNASYDLSDQLSLYFNSGFGFHSNDARAVVQSKTENTVPRAFGSEFGLRLHDANWSVCGAAWLLDVESELAWSGDEGTTESSGRTRRVGIDLDLRYSFNESISVGTDICTAHGRYRDESEGQNFIALAPSLTVSAFCTYSTSYYSTALRLRHISDRPANEDNSLVASGYTIADFTANIPVFSSLELHLECRNILNTAWKEAQFDTTSKLQNEAMPVSDIHFTSGTPRNVKVGLSYKF